MSKTKQQKEYSNDLKIKCCESPNINISNGNKVCINCGMVHDIILFNFEPRAYTKEEVHVRKKNEPRWRNYGPRTLISPKKADINGNYLNEKVRQENLMSEYRT